MAPFVYVPPTDDVLHHRTGTLMVAVASTVSWCCCVTLLSWISFHLLSVLRRPKSGKASRFAFLRTQFGLLFANLLVADLLQSTGFALNHYWYFTNLRPQASVSRLCPTQSVLIQAGDLGSAIWSFLIAAHTASFIIWRYKPSSKVVGCAVPAVWTIVVIMSAIGPIHVAYLRGRGQTVPPFYSGAGMWCWIALDYEPWRLWNHYLIVFISAFGSLFMYGGIFLFLWFRLFQAGAYNHQLFQLRRAADGRLVPTSPIAVIPATPAAGGDAGDASARFPNIEHELFKTSESEKEGDAAPVTATLNVQGAGWARRPSATTSLGAASATSKSEPRPPKIKQRIKDPNAVERNRRLDRAALMMLLFPAAYIISILPLAIFRLARVTKKPWTYNFDVQAGCGFLFALGGCFNAILYVITRKIFRPSKDSEHSQSNNGTSSPPSGPSASYAFGRSNPGGIRVSFSQADNGNGYTKEGSSGGLDAEKRFISFPSGMNVGGGDNAVSLSGDGIVAPVTAARRGSSFSFSGLRRNSGASDVRGGGGERKASIVTIGGSPAGLARRPTLQRKASALSQTRTARYAPGIGAVGARRRDDGTWSDGLSFQDSGSEEGTEEGENERRDDPMYAPAESDTQLEQRVTDGAGGVRAEKGVDSSVPLKHDTHSQA